MALDDLKQLNGQEAGEGDHDYQEPARRLPSGRLGEQGARRLGLEEGQQQQG